MPERTAEQIAGELRELRLKKNAVETQWKALRLEFIKALGQRSSAGDVRLIPKRKFVWKPSVIGYLIETLTEEGRARVLRPVAEEVEKLYADGRLSLTGMYPHIEKIEIEQSLDFPKDKKTPVRSTERQDFRKAVGA